MGEAFGRLSSGNPALFISKCFALLDDGGGRSIRIEKSWLNYKIDRPNASPLQNLSVWSLTPRLLTNSFFSIARYLKATTSVGLRKSSL